jgi:hypothetical protein
MSADKNVPLEEYLKSVKPTYAVVKNFRVDSLEEGPTEI